MWAETRDLESLGQDLNLLFYSNIICLIERQFYTETVQNSKPLSISSSTTGTKQNKTNKHNKKNMLGLAETRSTETCASFTAFPGQKQGAEPKVEQAGHEPASLQDAGKAGTGLAS